AASGKLPPFQRAGAAQPVNVPPTVGGEEANCCATPSAKNKLLALAAHNRAVETKAAQNGKKPNICIIWGDDIGQSNISAYTRGLMGYKTPNIDRVAKEGLMF